MSNDELAKAKALVAKMHRMGGPDPETFSDDELLEHYRGILEFEAMANGLEIESRAAS